VSWVPATPIVATQIRKKNQVVALSAVIVVGRLCVLMGTKRISGIVPALPAMVVS
jgi:hypothetical protein